MFEKVADQGPHTVLDFLDNSPTLEFEGLYLRKIGESQWPHVRLTLTNTQMHI